MKKRSLSLFLALLMVFGSVLPVFATESPAVEAAAEEQTPASTYADMYVQDGLKFRWDAYDLESIDGTTLTMTDKDGREKALTLAGVEYNSTYKVPETVSPIDFSSLVPRYENNAYEWGEIEFELVMTQTDYTGSGGAGTSPYINLGPVALSTSSYYEVPNSTFGGYTGYAMHSLTAFVSETTFSFAEGSVVVPNRRMMFNMMGTDGNLTRWFGNTLGQSYSVGAAMTFELPEDSMAGIMSLKLLRDRNDARVAFSHQDVANVWDYLSYIPGKEGKNTKINPATYDEALEMKNRDVALNSILPDIEYHFRVGGVYGGSTALKVGYHAFRLYNRLLSDAERQQNHFADLCAYHKVDMEKVAAYVALNDANKAAIYSQAQFCTSACSKESATNISFDDVTQKQLEDAIDAQVLLAESEAYTAKYEKLADLYVTENLIALWSAYGAKDYKGKTIGVIFKGEEGTELTYTENDGGSAAYENGYLRVINGKLTVSDVYDKSIKAVTGYTTEMIYATVDGNRQREYEGANFDKTNIPIFAEKVEDVFTVWGMSEHLSFTNAEGKRLQEEWAKAYLLANNDQGLLATSWFPISASHYGTLGENGYADKIRQVDGETGNKPYADYSMSGYEANGSTYNTAVGVTYQGVVWKNYYHGYYYVSQKYEGMADEYYGFGAADYVKPGIGNSYVMKSEFSRDGVLTGLDHYVLDFENWGPDLGNWSRYDFGVVTSHTWEERIDKNNSLSSNQYGIKTYGDSHTIWDSDAWGGATMNQNTDFVVNGFDADYYAIRIYKHSDSDADSKVEPLTDAQKAQNHFVDLISFHDIDIDCVEMFENLANKTALYEAFASTMVKDTSKAELESAILAASLGTTSTDLADTYVSFLGYQVKINGNVPGLRSVFEVHQNDTIENVELVEVGAIMAIAGDRTVADLTVAKNESNVYEAVGAQMMNAAVYKNSNWNDIYEHEDGVTTTFSYTCLFNDLTQDTEGEQAPADKLQTKLLFRGYAVVKVGDVEYVFYTDMTSETFPDATTEGVSMYDLSKVVPGNLSNEVIKIVEGPSEGEG